MKMRAQLIRLKHTCTWSWNGWRSAWKSEISLRQWCLAWALSSGLALWLDLTRGETALILSLGLLVIASELINTAIERTVDLVTQEHHDLAREAKDTGSAFVALTAIACGVAWAVILFG